MKNINKTVEGMERAIKNDNVAMVNVLYKRFKESYLSLPVEKRDEDLCKKVDEKYIRYFGGGENGHKL